MTDSESPNDRGSAPEDATLRKSAEETPTMAVPEPRTEASLELVPGAILASRYRIVSRLGKGGMGEVYRADDLKLGQPVALKFLTPGRALAARQQQLIDEVRVGRDVSHPNVCRLYDIGEFEGHLFISMEYIDGEDLASLLRRIGRLHGDKALALGRDICAGLAAAHDRGIVHRDLKPGNIMVDGRGKARITDFGLARAEGQEADRGAISGTPAYMAPEQFEGTAATVASDIYAVGLILFEIWSGRRIFSGKSLTEILAQHSRGTSRESLKSATEIDPSVLAVIEKCLAPDPAERPASARAVLAALPGRDAFEIAVAAGETPTPGMVAAASEKGDLSLLAAWSCFAVVVVALVVAFTGGLGPRNSVMERVRPSLPPAVLAVKAREAIRVLGHDGPCVDEASAFINDAEAIHAANSSSLDPAKRAHAEAAARRMILFWHRCSAAPLFTQADDGRVTPDDPPLGPGEALSVLDVDGRMMSYQAMPARDEASRDTSDFAAAFQRLAAPGIAPAATLPRGDGQFVYDVTLDGALPASVELDVRDGRLWRARVMAPWNAQPMPQNVPMFGLGDVRSLLTIGLVFVALPLARRNLRAGRGDRDGATRVGVFVFCCWIVGGLLAAHHTWTFTGEANLLWNTLAWALFSGVTTGLVYIALEPFVRRAWPERLVSWTRLIGGNVRDPMVARDVLVGVAAFCGLMLAILLVANLPGSTALGYVSKPLAPLLGIGQCAAWTALAAAGAVRICLIFLLLLLLLRALGRVRGLAPMAFITVLSVAMTPVALSLGASLIVSVALAVAFGIVPTVLLFRFGLLAMTATMFCGGLMSRFPDPPSVTGWTAFCAWWLIGVFILIATYGLYYSTNGQPFGKRSLLEDE